MHPRRAAGRSADEMFRKGRRHWRKQIRARLLLVLGVGAALALPVGLFAPHGTFFAGLVVGAVMALGLWVWDEPPSYVERWRQGRDGERWTAKELRKLRSQG